jgi:hypothetical protein
MAMMVTDLVILNSMSYTDYRRSSDDLPLPRILELIELLRPRIHQ